MLSVKPWKPDAVLQLLLAIMACTALGTLPLYFFLPKDAWETPEGRFLSFVFGSISFHGLTLVLFRYFVREHQIGWATAFGFRKSRLGFALLLAFAAALVLIPLTWELSNLCAWTMQSVQVKPEMQKTVEVLRTSVSPGQRVYFGIVTVGLAPVVEEILFRGIIYPTVKQLGFPHLALWGSSLFFAFVHLNAVTFVPLTVLAVCLALLYEYTDNLLAPILTHALFNGVNFAWLVLGNNAGF